MSKGTHIIHKLILHIEVSGRGAAQKVQDDAVRHFEQVLLKQLEQLLDSMDVPAHVLIDKIDLDLGSGRLENVFEQLATRLHHTLDQVINPGLPQAGINEDEAAGEHLLLTEEEQAFDVFIYFITTGRLPWYAAVNTHWLRQETVWLHKITQVLSITESSRARLIGVLKTSATALNRLFTQFSISFITALARVLSGGEDPLQNRAVELLTNEVRKKIAEQPGYHVPKAGAGKRKEYSQYHYSLIQTLITKLLLIIYHRTGKIAFPNEFILQRLTALIINELEITVSPSVAGLAKIADEVFTPEKKAILLQQRKPLATPDNSSQPKPLKDDEPGGIYVNQAGLVILHPFLEYFLKDFGLLQDDDFVDIHARQLAVHLLHYLGTGQVNAFEYDLYFEKFLCKWPADEPLERLVKIPQKMLDEGENMLRTVIKYWKALKNTSPGGLREAFIQRTGKLIETEKPYRLIVERKDMDILLSTLPWGIGVIKLPWMDEPFYVEWQ